jgi:hypothetical protein
VDTHNQQKCLQAAQIRKNRRKLHTNANANTIAIVGQRVVFGLGVSAGSVCAEDAGKDAERTQESRRRYARAADSGERNDVMHVRTMQCVIADWIACLCVVL